ncbi:MAG: gliding motility-associated C-terminal domain-containing protein [Saprospiraceae bacterium]|nr:gliding motility-associated C-terminal domain-containing protein [Saprospiraceae bacterium]
MRKFFIVYFLALLVSVNLNGQSLNVKFSNANVNAGDTANIDVTVANFTNLFGMQFSMNWDSTRFRYGAISNIISNTVLAGNLEIATPGPSSILKQGQLSCLWSNANIASLPANTRLFTVRLKAVGAECDSTELVGSNVPTKSEYYNENFETLPVSFTKGVAKINGSGCTGGGGGEDDIVVTAPILITPPNVELCIPITVTNFINIEGAQSRIKWDPTVLRMKPTPLKYDALPNNTYNSSNIAIGEFNFVWLTSGGPITIPNGQRLMEICFDVIGAVGSMTAIDLVNMDINGETEYTNSSGTPVPYVNIDGKVTVSAVSAIKITVADVTVKEGSNVDVSFKVDNFIDITGVQIGVTWDKSIIEFVERNGDALPGNPAGSLDPTANSYRFNWFAQGSNAVTLANGTTLFNFKFKGVGPCANEGTSVINVSDLPSFTVEFIDKNTVKVPYTVDAGSAKILPCESNPIECNITAFKNISCNGGSDGSITAVVTNATADCQCIWKKDGVAFGNPLPVASCNLTNIPSGSYVLEVTCSGTVQCSKSVTIAQPATGINIAGNVTNVACVTLGTITLNVTGGTPNYTFLWSPGNQTTKDLTGLAKGQYTVTVTDANQCTSTKSFDIAENPVEDLKVNSTVVNVKCFGESTGSIQLAISGGCPDYTVSWASSAETGVQRLNLPVGSYGVTVSDKSNPAKTVSQQIIIGGPASALTVNGVVTNSTGTNGAVDVSVSGGTAGYTYRWIEGSNATSEDISGLAPGKYTVEVTDNNGCKTTASFTVNLINNPTDPSFTGSVSSENANSGYGVSCVNACDAVISGTLDNTGKPPYAVSLSGAATGTRQLDVAGPFNFSGLCVGSYTVRVTDSNGKTANRSFTVTQPTIILISKTIECSDGALSTGSIDISVSGGAGSYVYAWSTGDNTQDLEDLEIGTYTVVVSDANGCQQTAQNLKVEDCNSRGDCFKDVRNIMTPNNDGSNDYFIISCAPDFNNELFVYNRWGKLVYSEKNYGNLWDGKDNDGTDLSENGYMWVLNVTQTSGVIDTYKGTVTILRD